MKTTMITAIVTLVILVIIVFLSHVVRVAFDKTNKKSTAALIGLALIAMLGTLSTSVLADYLSIQLVPILQQLDWTQDIAEGSQEQYNGSLLVSSFTVKASSYVIGHNEQLKTLTIRVIAKTSIPVPKTIMIWKGEDDEAHISTMHDCYGDGMTWGDTLTISTFYAENPPTMNIFAFGKDEDIAVDTTCAEYK